MSIHYILSTDNNTDKRQVDLIYRQALAMQQTALTDLIKKEQANTIYTHVNNPISTGTCLITDRLIQLPTGISKYTVQIPVPRFGDATQSFKIRLPDGHRVTTARAQINQEFNKPLTTRFEPCHVTTLPTTENEFSVLAYSELVVVACDNIFLELGCEVDSSGVGSSRPHNVQIHIQLWADYIFYSTNERSKKLFTNPGMATR
jgi:hypothetical protein